MAYPGEQVVFDCKSYGVRIIEWISEEYIGTAAYNLQLHILENIGISKSSVRNPETIATLVSVSIESGVIVIVSKLRIIASSQIPVSSVTCQSRESSRITFSTDGMAHMYL